MHERSRIDKERAARARAALSRLGISQTALARALGVSTKIVNEVARGRLIGERGKTHKVAVALGLKEGEIVPDDISVEELVKRLSLAGKEAKV